MSVSGRLTPNPHATCPECHGARCASCDYRGTRAGWDWVARAVESATENARRIEQIRELARHWTELADRLRDTFLRMATRQIDALIGGCISHECTACDGRGWHECSTGAPCRHATPSDPDPHTCRLCDGTGAVYTEEK
jgi:DnaJ-class molecular chaperone